VIETAALRGGRIILAHHQRKGHGTVSAARVAKSCVYNMTNIARPDYTQAHIVITIVALGTGHFEARVGEDVIVARTREPLLDGARALLAAGYKAATIAVLRHAGSEIAALTAPIGVAARYYVEESAHGPVLRSVRKAQPSAVERPRVGQMDRAAHPKRHPANDGARHE
jgi:hypothetical protein